MPTTINIRQQYARYFIELASKNGLLIDNFEWSDNESNPFKRCRSIYSSSDRKLDGAYVARIYNHGRCATFCGFDFHVSEHPIVFEKKYCDSSLSREDLSSIEEEIEKSRLVLNKKIAAKQAETEAKIPKILARCVPCPMNHPYIVKKHISKETVESSGLKMDRITKAIVLPLYAVTTEKNEDKVSPLPYVMKDGEKRYLNDKVTSLQYIMENGDKRFLSGGKIKGAHFLIPGDKGKTDTLLICEGLATGDALRQATGYPVVVCLCAHNIEYVCNIVEMIVKNSKDIKHVVICADNDCKNRAGINKGEICALNAAKKYNFKVAFCPSINEKSTDFNDLFISKGSEYIDDIIFNATYFTSNKEIDDSEILKACRGGDESRAVLFCKMFRNRFLFDAVTEEWYQFENHRWREDRTKNWFSSFDDMHKLFSCLLQSFENEYQKVNNSIALEKEKQKELNEKVTSNDEIKLNELKNRVEKIEQNIKSLRIALRQIESTKIRNNISAQIRCGRDRLVDGSDSWNKVKHVLPVANGVIDLKTCTLRKGTPDDRLTNGCETIFDPDAKCPQWENFLNTIFERKTEIIDFIQRYIGYSILRDPIEHKICIFYGQNGRNGKGVFKNVLGEVLGDFCYEAKSSLLTADLGSRENPNAPSAEEYALKDTALVFMSEVSEKAKFNLEKVKSLTGQDKINARPPFSKKPVVFSPTHSLILLCNNLPDANPCDSAFWSRCIVVEFRLHYTENPKKEYERQIDQHLTEKLLTERQGILNWVLDGVRKYNKDGLKIPEECSRAVEEYRDDNDELSEFFEECCLTGDSRDFESVSNLYTAYCGWNTSRGNVIPLTSDKKFGRVLKSIGYKPNTHQIKGKRYRCYDAIKLNKQGLKFL